MNDWLTQLETALDQMAAETELWVTAAVDTVIDASDGLADELEKVLEPVLGDLDRLAAGADPWVASAAGQFATWVEQTLTPVGQVVEPWLENRTCCVGCRNYHGHTYGDQTLVCAIHPYGPDSEQESCPDWESVWPG